MADFMTDITVTIDGGVKFVTGVTKETTCNDIIKSLTLKSGAHKCLQHSYAMFESSKGIERQLPGKTKVLKFIRSWGSDTGGFEFVLRQVKCDVKETKLSNLKQKMQKIRKKFKESKSDDKSHRANELAGMVKTQFSRLEKLQAITLNQNHNNDVKDYTKDLPVNQTTDSMVQFMTKVDSENMVDFLDFCCVVSNNEKKRLSRMRLESDVDICQKDSNITDRLKVCCMDQREGKREILKRFFSNNPFQSANQKSALSNECRTMGDGAESNACVVRRHVDGASFDEDFHDYDLDEAFVEEFDDACGSVLESSLQSNNNNDENGDDMNVCQLEGDMMNIIMNTSFCLSESDEGWSSIGSDM